MSKYTDKTLALAGMYQACQQVQQVARHGSVDPDELKIVLDTLFVTDPPDALSVYGNCSNLKSGLKAVTRQLEKNPDAELTRYLINILHLERKLTRKPELLQAISTGIERARKQTEHYPLPHSNIIASLAGTYSDTVSTMTPRIIVSGDQGHLANPENASTVRALLLAAMRSAVLWSQCGGSRWQILLQRKRFMQEATTLLQNPYTDFS